MQSPVDWTYLTVLKKRRTRSPKNESRAHHHRQLTSKNLEVICHHQQYPTKKTSILRPIQSSLWIKRLLQCPGNVRWHLMWKKSTKRRFGVQSSVENTFATIPIACEDNDRDILTFLERIRQEVKEIVLEELDKRKALRFYITVNPELQRISVDGDNYLASPYLHSRPAVVLYGTDLDEKIESAYARLTDLLECFQEKGSVFSLSHVASCAVNIVTYNVVGGSSFIELPPHVKQKHACVNIQNEDENCFQYCMLYTKMQPKINMHRPIQ